MKSAANQNQKVLRTFWLAITLISGCGQPYRVTEEAPAGAAVEFRMLPADPGQPRRPDVGGWDKAARAEVTESGWQFTDVVAVGGQTGPYLAWPDQDKDGAIVYSQIAARKRGADNRHRDGGGAAPEGVPHYNGRFYIPVLAAIGEEADHLDPADVYELQISWVLANGTRKEARIALRLRGRVQMPIRAVPAAAGATPGRLGALWSEEFRNPGSRPVRLWIRWEAPPRLQLYSLMRLDRHVAHPDAPPTPQTVRQYAEGQVQLTDIRATNGRDEVFESYRVRADDDGPAWHRFELPAGGLRRIEYLGRRADDAPRCAIPPAATMTYRWRIPGPLRGFPFAGFPQFIERQSQFVERWVVERQAVAGALSREIWVSDAYVDEDEVEARAAGRGAGAPESWARPFVAEDGTAERSLNVLNASAAFWQSTSAWGCQGVLE